MCAGLPAPVINNVTAWLQDGCQANLTGRQLYLQQDLFTIWVHRSPGEPGSDEDSIFYRREIPERCDILKKGRIVCRQCSTLCSSL